MNRRRINQLLGLKVIDEFLMTGFVNQMHCSLVQGKGIKVFIGDVCQYVYKGIADSVDLIHGKIIASNAQ